MSLINKIVSLRILIGFLGEKEQFGWWQSSFFSQNSFAFLSPIFSKTFFTAQYYGAKEAACNVHDEHIGIGEVFHLFRLPEHLEIEIHQSLINNKNHDQLSKDIKNKEFALSSLAQYNGKNKDNEIGPVRIGNISKIRTINNWDIVAAKYCKAFKSSNKIYPYFKKLNDK